MALKTRQLRRGFSVAAVCSVLKINKQTWLSVELQNGKFSFRPSTRLMSNSSEIISKWSDSFMELWPNIAKKLVNLLRMNIRIKIWRLTKNMKRPSIKESWVLKSSWSKDSACQHPWLDCAVNPFSSCKCNKIIRVWPWWSERESSCHFSPLWHLCSYIRLARNTWHNWITIALRIRILPSHTACFWGKKR